MFDPRSENLSELTDDKLTDRIGDLHKRMRSLYKKEIYKQSNQLNVMLQDANAEQQRRWAQNCPKHN